MSPVIQGHVWNGVKRVDETQNLSPPVIENTIRARRENCSRPDTLMSINILKFIYNDRPAWILRRIILIFSENYVKTKYEFRVNFQVLNGFRSLDNCVSLLYWSIYNISFRNTSEMYKIGYAETCCSVHICTDFAYSARRVIIFFCLVTKYVCIVGLNNLNKSPEYVTVTNPRVLTV